LLKRRADSREPQQRSSLPLYNIPRDSAHRETLDGLENHQSC
jgi:hypothetical protein